jgi:hypothetical protein
MGRLSWTLSIARLLTLLVGSASFAKAESIDYLAKIKPLLAHRCYACHGALKQESGLRLDTAASAIKGGDSGPAVTPGDPASSLLIERVSATDVSERMPPEGKPLEPEEIAALRAWIAENAKAPPDETPERDPRDHWAFRPIKRPTAPESSNSQGIRNPIDAFIAEKHRQRGLTPQAEAPREVLVRRLYLDLIGLPPTENELAQVDETAGESWYELLVDRLMNDPRHGERWARHWMDIWRYSEWWGLGDQLRNSQPHIWHWRDWIVESLNSNTPYDEMVRLMLAADELHPNDLDKLRATGFLARNWALFGRNLWMEETVEHVSKGFLGLTMNCAKCHDHKFDPIPQTDFYRLRAFFEPYHVRMDMVPGEPDLTRDGIPRVFDGVLDAVTYRFERGQESQPDKSTPIAPGVPEFLSQPGFAVQPVTLPKEAWQPERRTWVLETHKATAKKNLTSAEDAAAAAEEKLQTAEKELQELAASGSDNSPPETAQAALADAKAALHAAILAAEVAQAEVLSVDARAEAMRAAWVKADDAGGDPKLAAAETSLAAAAFKAERRAAVAQARRTVADIELRLLRSAADAKAGVEKELADAREALAKAERSAAAALTPEDRYTPLTGAKWTPTRFLTSTADDPAVSFPPQSTGRRTALAAWITDRRNPLTARVAVNHIWARHMGEPLVATVFDFGRNGSPPTQPELLDWLAAEFIDSGWDMKHLHRLIVLSSAYRMSSSVAGRESNLAKDPDNLCLWRRKPVRLESQVVRDSILWLAGTLDLARGGPPVLPAAQVESTRRSLYFFHSNNERNSFLTTFDEAGVKECYRRDQSIVPQQALALSNSRLVQDAALQIAQRLSQPVAPGDAPPDDREFIRRAFYVTLGIRANDDELRASSSALKAWRKLPREPKEGSDDAARQNLIWALINHNDFVTVR